LVPLNDNVLPTLSPELVNAFRPLVAVVVIVAFVRVSEDPLSVNVDV
jgi:hypothetical protein